MHCVRRSINDSKGIRWMKVEYSRVQQLCLYKKTKEYRLNLVLKSWREKEWERIVWKKQKGVTKVECIRKTGGGYMMNLALGSRTEWKKKSVGWREWSCCCCSLFTQLDYSFDCFIFYLHICRGTPRWILQHATHTTCRRIFFFLFFLSLDFEVNI